MCGVAALPSYRSFVDLINPHKGTVMAWWNKGVKTHFLVCYEYFSNHRVYKMTLLLHHWGEHCDFDLLVIYTSLPLSALSII